MIPGHATAQTPAVRLPLLFIITGVISFFLAQLLLLLSGNVLTEGTFRTPTLWAIMHLWIIGWAIMVTMGAVYQLLPVVFQIRIFSEKLGYVQFTVMLVALVGFLIALYSFDSTMLVLCGAFLFGGFMLFLVNISMTMHKIKAWNTLKKIVVLSIIALGGTVLCGLLLVFQLSFSFLNSQWHLPLLYAHMTLGLAGWFTLLIIAFSYKLVPMFSLAHGFSMQRTGFILTMYVCGLSILLLSYFIMAEKVAATLTLSGAWLLWTAFLTFAMHIRHILSLAMKKNLDFAFRYSLYAIWIGLGAVLLFALWATAHFSHTMGWLNIFWSLDSPTIWLIGTVYLFFMGWISLSILGYLFKIVPFLWWTEQYSAVIGREDVPLLKDMIPERISKWTLPGIVLATCLVLLSILGSSSWLFFVGQSMLVLFTALYCTIVLNVFRK